jgi:replicative DNA helicase
VIAEAGARPLPGSPEAEAAVLGGILARPELLPEVAAILAPEDFSARKHAAIFEAMLVVDGLGKLADVVAVTRELQMTDVPPMLVRDLAAEVMVPDAAPQHARTVAALAVDRRIALRMTDALNEALAEGDPAEIAASVSADLLDLTAKQAQEQRPIADLIDGVVAQFEAGPILGLPTGFAGLDRLLGGLLPGQLALVAARPGVGKTSLASAIARNAARVGPVAFFSYGMSAEEIATRLLCSEASVSYSALRAGRGSSEDWVRLVEAVGAFLDSPLRVIDDATAQLPQLRLAARRMAGRVLIVVDYIQLMPSASPRSSRQEQVAEISRGLKLLARELGVPVLACCQLNRQAEQRQDKRPKLPDLRESGALEQDADVVMLLHRDDQNPAHAEIIVAKQRNGPTGTVRVSFEREHTSFRDLGW